MLGILWLLSIVLSLDFIHYFFVGRLGVHLFLHWILVGILVTQYNLALSLFDRENVYSSLIRRASDPLRHLIKSNRVDLSFVCASSNFLQRCTILCREQPNQSTLVTRCGKEISLEIQSD